MRFTAIHIVAGVVATVLVGLHLVFVHRGAPGTNNSGYEDAIQLQDVLIKDTMMITILLTTAFMVE